MEADTSPENTTDRSSHSTRNAIDGIIPCGTAVAQIDMPMSRAFRRRKFRGSPDRSGRWERRTRRCGSRRRYSCSAKRLPGQRAMTNELFRPRLRRGVFRCRVVSRTSGRSGERDRPSAVAHVRIHYDGRQIAGMVDVHVRQKNQFDRGKIETASPDALEDAAACIDENARPFVDRDDVSGRGSMRVEIGPPLPRAITDNRRSRMSAIA